MSYAQPKQYFAATHRAVNSALGGADAIEWEELPSLASSLAQRLVRRGLPQARANDSTFSNSRSFSAPWDNTLHAALETALPSQPFQELLKGLETREVNEPDVFHHFFGDGAVR